MNLGGNKSALPSPWLPVEEGILNISPFLLKLFIKVEGGRERVSERMDGWMDGWMDG
jgi:hypothetical protein